MLRAIITDSPSGQKWILQGRLCGRWADDLKEKWAETKVSRLGSACTVELEDVITVDRTGEAVLLEMAADGARLIARRAYMKHKLEEIGQALACAEGRK